MKTQFKKLGMLSIMLLLLTNLKAQEKSIKDLEFLIGSWETREDNAEKTWWETSIRTFSYMLDSTVLEVRAVAASSSGKQRKMAWYIHYNRKIDQFEMVSMFSNWHAIQLDLLDWDAANRKLTIRHDPDRGTADYHERFGEIVFTEDFNAFTWKGKNKYGNPDEPSIWVYTETGKRVKTK